MIPRRDFIDKWKHLESRAHELAKKLTGKDASMPRAHGRSCRRRPPEKLLFLSVTTSSRRSTRS